MKRKPIFLTVALALVLPALVFASSAADLYAEFSLSVKEGNVQEARDNYDKFLSQLEEEWNNTETKLSKAREKRNSELYLENLEELKALSRLGITKEESDALLAAIVNMEDEEAMLESARWLYDVSPYYRPNLAISLSHSSSGSRYSYSSSVSIKPGEAIELPSQHDLGYSVSSFGHLSGWGITPDEVLYQPGETITMPVTDQTLYAVWENGVFFLDENGEVQDAVLDVKAGDVISIPPLEDGDGVYYLGWYDSTSGEFLPKSDTEYTVRGQGAEFEGLYIELDPDNASVSPYDKIPTSTQVKLSFDVKNLGNEDSGSVKVELSSTSDHVNFIDDKAYFRNIPASSTGRVEGVKFVVSSTADSGEEIPITVTLTDSEERVWTDTFTFQVR